MSTSTPDYQGWRMEAAVISTGHLTKETMNALVEDAFSLRVIPYREGAFVHFDADFLDMKVLPEDLRACIEWGLNNEFSWLRFDADGDEVDELPFYEWE